MTLAPETTADFSPGSAPHQLACRLCGYEHRPVALKPGERALCIRCGAVLAKRNWLGPDAALAFCLTGAVLAIPAVLLPFITVSKLRSEHVTYLFTGVTALWSEGMRLLAVWVFLCGTLAPALLLGSLLGLLVPSRFRRPVAGERVLWRTVHALEHWTMPEVHVLAVLVALIKLGTIVGVTVGPGFWCYVAMSVMILFAWRNFQFNEPAPRRVGLMQREGTTA
jgi:paraquat-inducible protein A